jgi:trimethylamine--corrinoid protein Co-methyltransferase
LLVQENAGILAHVTLAQIFRPGTPVLYGTVSTIANMRLGTVALGAVETGLITAASAQLARHYGLPCRGVGATTEAKAEDVQAGLERAATLLQAVLAGVHFITCGGTLDSSMLESDPLLLLDDELCGAALRVAQGITVDQDALALDVIRRVVHTGPGNYLAERHTLRHFRQEHFLPRLAVREPHDAWVEAGSHSALDRARDRVRELLMHHQPRQIDPALEAELDQFRQMVASRPIDEFYLGEIEDRQDYQAL